MTIADLPHGSDDDEDDEEEEPEEEGEDQTKKEGEAKSEVKTEPGANKRKTKDANELHIYHEDELMALEPNRLHGDVELLDGACIPARDTAC